MSMKLLPIRDPPGVDAPLRILIVEDHPIITLALKVALEGLGEQVVGEAVDADGVRRHDLAAVDLAFVDVNLADGPTGPAVAAWLVEQGVCVVFHTSNPERIPAGFDGAVGVLEKPSTAAGLHRIVELARHVILRRRRD